MRGLCLAVVAAILFCTCGHAGDLSGAWIYVNDVEWRSPPPQLQKSYQEGDAEIVLLYKNGEFALISATLFRDNATGKISICEGCGFSVRKGNWKSPALNSLVETSAWTYRDVPAMVGGKPAPPETTETTWVVEGRRSDGAPIALVRAKQRFTPLGSLSNPKVLDQILLAH